MLTFLFWNRKIKTTRIELGGFIILYNRILLYFLSSENFHIVAQFLLRTPTSCVQGI